MEVLEETQIGVSEISEEPPHRQDVQDVSSTVLSLASRAWLPRLLCSGGTPGG